MTTAPDSEGLDLLVVGDARVFLPNPAAAYELSAHVLRSGHVAVANLEGVICDEGLPPLPGKVAAGSAGHRRMPVAAEQGLVDAGIHAVALANNHSMDYQEAGMLQTVEVLDKAGIGYTGGGRNLAEAHRPWVTERNGKRVALLAYTSVFVPGSFPATETKPGAAVVRVFTAYEAPYNAPYSPGVPPRILTYPDQRDRERMLEDVRTAKESADFVVVSWHWGLTPAAIVRATGLAPGEIPCFVLNYQEDLARQAIDEGADLIMGHHPHQLQGMEVYKGKLICYSLGNFAMVPYTPGQPVYPEDRPLLDKASAIVRCSGAGGDSPRFSFFPVVINSDGRPEVVDPSGQHGVTQLVASRSRKYGTSFRIDGQEVVISASAG